MGNKSADLVTQTFITRFDWKVQVCYKSADLADWERKSAPFGGR